MALICPGIVRGMISTPCARLLSAGCSIACACSLGGGAGGGASITGVASGLRNGNAIGRISGIKSKIAVTVACSAKEVSVVQLLRVCSAHEVSSALSANMASSCVERCFLYGHRRSRSRRGNRKEKGRVSTRPLGTFTILQAYSQHHHGGRV